VLALQLTTQAQIDQRKLDSLRRSIDSFANTHKLWQDSFTKVQDSVYQDAINKTDLNKQKELSEQHERESQRRKILQGIIIALALVATALLLLLRRRKKNT
jgi:hypothetical protein